MHVRRSRLLLRSVCCFITNCALDNICKLISPNKYTYNARLLNKQRKFEIQYKSTSKCCNHGLIFQKLQLIINLNCMHHFAYVMQFYVFHINHLRLAFRSMYLIIPFNSLILWKFPIKLPEWLTDWLEYAQSYRYNSNRDPFHQSTTANFFTKNRILDSEDSLYFDRSSSTPVTKAKDD